jgi:hypothetical protein
MSVRGLPHAMVVVFCGDVNSAPFVIFCNFAEVGAYVLNFNGRVTMASVKNFQLVDSQESKFAHFPFIFETSFDCQKFYLKL